MTKTPKTAIVLFGHGARDPQWAQPMQGLQNMLRQQLPGHSVELAFLELMQPTLLDAVASLVSRGELIIKIVPVFFGRGGHLKNDYPVLLKQLASIHPQVSIVSTEAVGQWDAVWQAIASEIVATL